MDKTNVPQTQNGNTQISSLLKVGGKVLSTISSLAELNAIRELLGTSMSPDDLNGLGAAAREEWDLLMSVIKAKLADFGEECTDDQILIGQSRKDDTMIALQLRAARLSLVTATLKEMDQNKGMLEIISPDTLGNAEREELDKLRVAFKRRMSELTQAQ